MFSIQLFTSLFISIFTILNLTTASKGADGMEGNGVGSANDINIPEKPKTAIHRALSTSQRHRGNRMAGESSSGSKVTVSRQKLSRKIIKEAHQNFRSRAQRQSAIRASGKVAPEPNAE